MKLYDELVARGLIAQVTNEEEIREMIDNGKATFYIGFDCTADSLTAGHFMALTLMKRLQMAGNKPIALIGGGTTMIGDPSGRTDMRKMLTKEDIAGLITDAAIDSAGTALVAGSGLFGEGSPNDLARRFGMDGLHTEQLEDYLTDKVWEGIKTIDIGSIVAAKANEVVRSNPMLSFLPVGSIIATIKAKVGEYVDSEECRMKIAVVVSAKVAELKEAPTGETLASVGMSETAAEGLVVSVIHRLLDTYPEPVLNMLHIDRIIEDKINDMDIAMFEELVMSVMKNELNAIVNLGFFIGLIIGVINIFI